jgi:hypothetical protein
VQDAVAPPPLAEERLSLRRSAGAEGDSHGSALRVLGDWSLVICDNDIISAITLNSAF